MNINYNAPVTTDFNPVMPLEYTLSKGNIPEFDPKWLPEPFRSYAEALAEEAQVLPDIPCISLLGAVSAAAQKLFRVKPAESFVSSLNLYLMVGADPGSRKSTVQRRVCEPFQKLEEAFEDYRLLFQDFTFQKIVRTMKRNGEKGFLTSADGDILSNFSQSKNLDFFLKCFDGDRVSYDTVRDGEIILHHPTMSVLAFSQTGPVKEFITNPRFEERGLLSRFLYVFPETPRKAPNLFSKKVPDTVRMDYCRGIASLLMTAETAEEIRNICFSEEATHFLEELNASVYAEDSKYAALGAWKYRACEHFSKIAGILHCMKYGIIAADYPVSEGTARNAMAVLDYFAGHMLRIHGKQTIQFGSLNDAKYLLKHLEILAKENTVINERTLLQKCRGKFPKTESAVPGLRELERCGYIKIIQTRPTGAGRPSNIINLNPVHFFKVS